MSMGFSLDIDNLRRIADSVIRQRLSSAQGEGCDSAYSATSVAFSATCDAAAEELLLASVLRGLPTLAEGIAKRGERHCLVLTCRVDCSQKAADHPNSFLSFPPATAVLGFAINPATGKRTRVPRELYDVLTEAHLKTSISFVEGWCKGDAYGPYGRSSALRHRFSVRGYAEIWIHW